MSDGGHAEHMDSETTHPAPPDDVDGIYSENDDLNDVQESQGSDAESVEDHVELHARHNIAVVARTGPGAIWA